MKLNKAYNRHLSMCYFVLWISNKPIFIACYHTNVVKNLFRVLESAYSSIVAEDRLILTESELNIRRSNFTMSAGDMYTFTFTVETSYIMVTPFFIFSYSGFKKKPSSRVIHMVIICFNG